jgi:hypothetical protein
VDIWRVGKLSFLTVLALTPIEASSVPAENRARRDKNSEERVAEVKERLNGDSDRLEALYKHLHSNPELSLNEARTSARLARELKEIGFEVIEGVGGYGIVGVLKNGDGPTVMVRTGMDALPVIEHPELPTPARCGRATKIKMKSASCTPAATTCT